MPVPTTSPSPTASSEPTPVIKEPKLLPGGTALANREYFDFVNERLFTEHPDANGQQIIDNLALAGFDKAAMQVTKDTTPTGRAPEAIEFSVNAGADCLIGQLRRGEYTSFIGPALGTGACLIGDTRPIDW